MIILDEKQYARRCLEENSLGENTYITLSIIAKYYYFDCGYKNKKIKELLAEFLNDNLITFHKEENVWIENIEKIVFDNEPHLALYASDNGLYFYKKILKDAQKFLKKSFLIAFEIGELQGNEVRNIVYEYFDNVDVIVEKDYSERDRFVFVFSK